MVLNWHELIIKSRVVGIPLPIKHFFCPLSHYGTDIDPKHIFCPVSNFEHDWDSLNLAVVKHSPTFSLFFITIGKAPFVLLDVLLQPVWPMCPSLPALSLFVLNVFCLFFSCLFACFNQMHSCSVFLQNQCHLETICWTEFMAGVEWTQQNTGVVEHIS